MKEAIEQKAKKYGKLSLPLVIAINVVSEHCDDIDINNALFGSEAIQIQQRPDGSVDGGINVRVPNGIWFGKKGARNRNVSAVLIGCQIDPYRAGAKPPKLIHNPYAENPLDIPDFEIIDKVLEDNLPKIK